MDDTFLLTSTTHKKKTPTNGNYMFCVVFCTSVHDWWQPFICQMWWISTDQLVDHFPKTIHEQLRHFSVLVAYFICFHAHKLEKTTHIPWKQNYKEPIARDTATDKDIESMVSSTTFSRTKQGGKVGLRQVKHHTE